jgi:Uma2 family endonuclease
MTASVRRAEIADSVYPPLNARRLASLRATPDHSWSDAEFLAFCRENEGWRIEQNSEGEIEIMSPTGGQTGYRNLLISSKLARWAERNGTGKAFDSSTLFKFSNRAKRSPDASWVLQTRLDALTDDECDGPLPLCPDFVIELRSKTDSLKGLHAKMREYIANGARLGWLIDPTKRTVHVYRPDREPEIVVEPKKMYGKPELPGFTLDADTMFASLKRR